MRKILAASLIVILFVNLFGYFISFTAERMKIHEEVKQMMLQAKLKDAAQFVFTNAEYEKLSKYENGKEFSLKGELYDVVSKKMCNGKIILTAVYDHSESDLFHEFVSFFKNETSSEKNKQQQISSFTLFEFIAATSIWKCFATVTSMSLPSYSSALLAFVSSIQLPPPDATIVV